MKKNTIKDGRLLRVVQICRSLPEARHEQHAQHATFLVHDRVFAYYLNNHHGDGMVGIACKALPGDNDALIASRPERFYMPAYVGPRGWVALRLDVAGVDWSEVAELVLTSYKLVAPDRLARLAKSEAAQAAAAAPGRKPAAPGRSASAPRQASGPRKSVATKRGHQKSGPREGDHERSSPKKRVSEESRKDRADVSGPPKSTPQKSAPLSKGPRTGSVPKSGPQKRSPQKSGRPKSDSRKSGPPQST